MPEDRSAALAALGAAVREPGGTLSVCFPHREGDGLHVVVSRPSQMAAAGEVAGSGRGDEASIDVLVDLRGHGWREEDGYDPDEYEDAMWDGMFSPVAMPDEVDARVWACFDEGCVGLVWQLGDGPRYLMLLPDEFAQEFGGWLEVAADWPSFVCAALFAPVIETVGDDDDDEDDPDGDRGSAGEDWRAMRTPAENQRALERLSEMAEHIATHADNVSETGTDGGTDLDGDPMTLDRALGLLGWAGAGHCGMPTKAVLDRYGCAAGRFVYEWTSHGYTEADRAHFTSWLGEEVDDELLLWTTDGGDRFATLMGWIDGAEPLLHGVDSLTLVAAVRLSCDWADGWSAAQVRRLWDSGLRDPGWWHVLAHGYRREHNLFERDPAIVAALKGRDIEDTTTPVGYTLIAYALDWADAMPIDAAVWYIAHRVPRVCAKEAYAKGGFDPQAFRTLWALAPAGTSEAERLLTLDRFLVDDWHQEAWASDVVPVPR